MIPTPLNPQPYVGSSALRSPPLTAYAAAHPAKAQRVTAQSPTRTPLTNTYPCPSTPTWNTYRTTCGSTTETSNTPEKPPAAEAAHMATTAAQQRSSTPPLLATRTEPAQREATASFQTHLWHYNRCTRGGVMYPQRTSVLKNTAAYPPNSHSRNRTV